MDFCSVTSVQVTGTILVRFTMLWIAYPKIYIWMHYEGRIKIFHVQEQNG